MRDYRATTHRRVRGPPDLRGGAAHPDPRRVDLTSTATTSAGAPTEHGAATSLRGVDHPPAPPSGPPRRLLPIEPLPLRSPKRHSRPSPTLALFVSAAFLHQRPESRDLVRCRAAVARSRQGRSEPGSQLAAADDPHVIEAGDTVGEARAARTPDHHDGHYAPRVVAELLPDHAGVPPDLVRRTPHPGRLAHHTSARPLGLEDEQSAWPERDVVDVVAPEGERRARPASRPSGEAASPPT